MSSARRSRSSTPEKNNPVADIGDIGIRFGPVAVGVGAVEAYKPTRWDLIPELREGPTAIGCAGTPARSRSRWTQHWSRTCRARGLICSSPNTRARSRSATRDKVQPGAMTVLAADVRRRRGRDKIWIRASSCFENLDQAGNFTPVLSRARRTWRRARLLSRSCGTTTPCRCATISPPARPSRSRS